MWLYPKVVGFNPPERWGHSACFFEGVVYVFGVRIRRPSTSPAVFFTPHLLLPRSLRPYNSFTNSSATCMLFWRKSCIFSGVHPLEPRFVLLLAPPRADVATERTKLIKCFRSFHQK
jgi:hypothetical protein